MKRRKIHEQFMRFYDLVASIDENQHLCKQVREDKKLFTLISNRISELYQELEVFLESDLELPEDR